MARIITYQSLKESLFRKSQVDQRRSSGSNIRATPRRCQPTIIPYRDLNGVLNYATLPLTQQGDDNESTSPLITPGGGLDEDQHDALQRFTATGKPIPLHKPTTMGLCIAPHFPQRYTDESIIPVVVKVSLGASTAPKARKTSFFSKFKADKTDNVRVFFMPRGEYLKYFSREDGVYSGTEPERQWTEEELEEKYGKYKNLRNASVEGSKSA